MTPFRWGIVAFWVFIVLALIWQFHSYNNKLETDAEAHPAPQHYWGPLAATYAPPPPAKVAKVQEKAYWVTSDPTGQMFTVHLTLINVGGSKATGVTANVNPYNGALNYDPDSGGHQSTSGRVTGGIGQWISFPDIDPGQSDTETADFVGTYNPSTMTDPTPKIVFVTAP